MVRGTVRGARWVAPFVGGAVLLLPLMFVLFGWYCTVYAPGCVNRTNYASVGDEFALSLIYNDEKVAKALAHPDEWAQIEQWMSQHKPYTRSMTGCGDWDTPLSGGVGSQQHENDDQARYGVYYRCPAHCCYWFAVTLELERISGEWRVTQWYEVEERWRE